MGARLSPVRLLPAGVAGTLVTALNGPSPPQKRGQLALASSERAVPPPEASSQPTDEARDPRRHTPRPGLPSTSLLEHGTDPRECERKGGAGEREAPLPVATAHLVAEHSWEGRERGREWGREGRNVESPGSSARGSSPAHDPGPPPYAGACVGT